MFEVLKGSVPIELKLSFKENMYYITAVTLPRMAKSIRVRSYLHNSVHGYKINIVVLITDIFVLYLDTVNGHLIDVR